MFLRMVTRLTCVEHTWNQHNVAFTEGLNDVSKWCHQNRMVFNPGKTKSMVVAARQRHQLKPLMLKLAFGTDIVEQDKNTSLSP